MARRIGRKRAAGTNRGAQKSVAQDTRSPSRDDVRRSLRSTVFGRQWLYRLAWTDRFAAATAQAGFGQFGFRYRARGRSTGGRLFGRTAEEAERRKIENSSRRDSGDAMAEGESSHLWAATPDLIGSDAGRGGWRWVGRDGVGGPRDGFAGAPQIRNERGQKVNVLGEPPSFRRWRTHR